MILAISALKGYAVEASDGKMGTVDDFLFDDRSWKVRWLVVDTGNWLTRRKILVHPSAIRAPDHDGEKLPVMLTRAQVEGSPTILEHEPVSGQMEARLFSYYEADPIWGDGSFGAGTLAVPFLAPAYTGGSESSPRIDADPAREGEDPHLCSISEVKDYRIRATDGEIGHAENFLVDDGMWEIRYIIVDTRNWWPGEHVLISPYAVQAVVWSEREIRLNVDRERVKSSPPWNPIAMIDQVYERQLHKHYGWRGYGF